MTTTTIIAARNVAEALPVGVRYLLEHGQPESSRAGDVLVSPGPVTTVYQRPCERVLFSATRDANPFFHAMEAIWMLAGRDNAGFLTRYVRDFAERCAEPGGAIHGAYGRRWRDHFRHPDQDSVSIDQLDWAVARLRENPASRQVVITMWDPEADCTSHPLKDRPCNTQVFLRVRQVLSDDIAGSARVLDLQVNCRSNDIVWGAYGANAVHFSVLQEYLAARIGVGVGTMFQVSWNFHAYATELERLRDRVSSGTRSSMSTLPNALADQRYGDEYVPDPRPMFDSPDKIDEDVVRFCAWHQGSLGLNGEEPVYHNPWFRDTAEKIALSHWLYKHGKRQSECVDIAHTIVAEDWRVACVEWLRRRIK